MFFPKVRWYGEYTGLWQNWEMFSPDPPNYSLHVLINATTKKGDEITFEPNDSWASTRVRKFLENIIDLKMAMKYYLQYWCKQMQEKDVKEVKLLVKKQLIIPFGQNSVDQANYEEKGKVSCEDK